MVVRRWRYSRYTWYSASLWKATTEGMAHVLKGSHDDFHTNDNILQMTQCNSSDVKVCLLHRRYKRCGQLTKTWNLLDVVWRWWKSDSMSRTLKYHIQRNTHLEISHRWPGIEFQNFPEDFWTHLLHVSFSISVLFRQYYDTVSWETGRTSA